MLDIHDIAGSWLVTRADSVHVPKGSYIVIEPAANPDEATFSLYAPWSKAVSYEGTATLHEGQLHFQALGTLPVTAGPWDFHATVMTGPEGKRFLFGLAVQGDPHAAGVFGAEEDGSG